MLQLLGLKPQLWEDFNCSLKLKSAYKALKWALSDCICYLENIIFCIGV